MYTVGMSAHLNLRMLEGQEKTAMVYQMDYGPGDNHIIEETTSPVRDSGGDIVRAVLVVKDVTKRLVLRYQSDFFLDFFKKKTSIVKKRASFINYLLKWIYTHMRCMVTFLQHIFK